jgi:hypothetical protein
LKCSDPPSDSQTTGGNADAVEPYEERPGGKRSVEGRRVGQQQACRLHLNLKYSVLAAAQVLDELGQELLPQLKASESATPAAHV